MSVMSVGDMLLLFASILLRKPLYRVSGVSCERVYSYDSMYSHQDWCQQVVALDVRQVVTSFVVCPTGLEL